MHQQYKMENDEFEQACIKNRTCYSFDDIIKWEDCYLDNLIIDQKSRKNLLIYDISHKTLMVQNICELGSIKQMYLLKFMMDLNIEHYLVLKNMMLFTAELDIL